jgi:hypothetical protein
MSYQSPPNSMRTPSDAGARVAQLHEVLRLVEVLGGARPSNPDEALDEAARLSGAYAHAEPLDRRRFDILARETASWSAAAAEALLAAGESRSPAAARVLADELGRSLSALAGLLRPAGARPGR